jgi:hypothetical protein
LRTDRHLLRLESLELFPYLVEQLGQRQMQCPADRRQQFGRDLLATAFELGEIGHRHPRGGGNLSQRAALGQPRPA